MKEKYYKAILVVAISLFSYVNTTLSPSNKVKPKSKELKIKVKTGPQELNVFDRKLVEEEPLPKDILIENAAYYKDTSNKLFNGTVLGYVTPWNNVGYDVAKKWGSKFDVISPVWLQVMFKGPLKYALTGTHDIDDNWLKEVRKSNTKIFPRIVFEKFDGKHLNQIMLKENEKDAICTVLEKACRNYKFDGYVLEGWNQWSTRFSEDVVVNFFNHIAISLAKKGCNIILVIPPKRNQWPDMFSNKHFEQLYPHIHSFSLTTYDFSTVQRPGANAPLYWMEEAVKHIVPETVKDLEKKRSKILLGLNIYGNDFTPDGGGPIIGQQYLDLLKHTKKRLIHDERDKENFFEVKDQNGRHIVFYPSLYSINERINLARKLGVGLALWELGQGLPYFYDLF